MAFNLSRLRVCALGLVSAVLLVVASLFLSVDTSAQATTSGRKNGEWKLTWSDEFNGPNGSGMDLYISTTTGPLRPMNAIGTCAARLAASPLCCFLFLRAARSASEAMTSVFEIAAMAIAYVAMFGIKHTTRAAVFNRNLLSSAAPV